MPLPNVTPLIVAAIPIANDLDADTLFGYLQKVLDGLIARGIQVISYACDGTEVERSVQRLLVERAERRIEHIIKNPRSGAPDTKVTIAVYHGQPMCMIQDSKHALKTFRNNLFSGARLLTLGNYTAMYRHIRELAEKDGSPLYRRDVEKLDRQDDNAASRLFSSHTLQYLADHHPDYIGEIVYLFVFGELVDAYQNRAISHLERMKLALRARYFLDAWESSLDKAKYKKAQHFLSREAVDIAWIIIEGYIGLVIIHRDHVSGWCPLLPWLHSSEACEHCFGEARQVVKDFCLLDFLYMIPKLRIKLREAIFQARLSNPKATAAGYSHTYFDIKDINLVELAKYPTNDEIDTIAEQASEENDSLIALLGLVPSQLRRSFFPYLPNIQSWYDSDLSDDEEDMSDMESITEAQELQGLLDAEENVTISRNRKGDEIMANLTCAAFAVMADEMAVVYVQYYFMCSFVIS